ncbi:MAG: efflux RND transporter periplasmic adaptor subunit [Flavobacteriales bacterium]|nr:efflux RND transporter periplasmic adaptor subunit [Flavobacteriales bacterium]
MVRKIIVVVVSIAILAGGIFLKKTLEDSKKPPVKKKEKQITSVYTQQVKNETVGIELSATGMLTAKNRVELYAEVQGVMTSSAGNFKAGERYSKGARLVSIESDVYRAGLMAQKSTLQNLVTAALADIRLDFPESFERWNKFLSDLDVNKSLPSLPETASDKEKQFITGRNIYTTYYNLKNMELTLAKYDLSAPFDGILTEALVTPGTLIRPGQKLGTFIDPTVYEMETPVSTSMINLLKIGQNVDVHSTGSNHRSWNGRIIRINGLVNSGTQTINVYIEVAGSGLEEGMFLEASIAATEAENAFEIDRSVLFSNNQVYVVADSMLVQKTIDPVYFNERTVVVRGLSDNEQVLTKMPPGSFPGMKVSIFNN